MHTCNNADSRLVHDAVIVSLKDRDETFTGLFLPSFFFVFSFFTDETGILLAHLSILQFISFGATLVSPTTATGKAKKRD